MKREWLPCGLKLIGLAVLSTLALGQTQVSADYAAAVLADNPLGYWRFEAEGDVAVNSGTAGSELDGEYIDVGRVPGPDMVNGREVTGLGADNVAISVGDDIPSYVGVNASPMNDLDTETGFTFEGWVNAGPRDFNRIGLWGQNDVPEFGFISPTRIQLWTPNGSSVNWDFTEDDIQDNTWFHIAATASIEETLLYINGELVMSGSPAGGGTFGFSDFTFNIGGGGVYDGPDANDGNQFTGLIDEVAIWTDRVLTEEEIQAHFNAAFEAAGDPWDELDNLTDPTERLNYVHDVLNTWMGDSNKDGEFNSSDLVTALSAGEYEDSVIGNSTWVTGDWDGDKDFTSADLVTALADGGYDAGPRPATQAVPEPSGLLMITMLPVVCLRLRRAIR